MTFQEVVIHFECYPLLLLLWNFSTLSRHLFQLLYQNSVNKKLQMFQSVGPEGDSVCFSGEFWATKKAPESVPVGLG